MNDGVVYFVSSNYSLSSETSLHCVIIKHKAPNGMEISVKHFLSLYLSNILNAFIVPPLETVVWWILPSQEFLDKADMYPWCFSLWRATRNIWGVLRNFSDTFSHCNLAWTCQPVLLPLTHSLSQRNQTLWPHPPRWTTTFRQLKGQRGKYQRLSASLESVTQTMILD